MRTFSFFLMIVMIFSVIACPASLAENIMYCRECGNTIPEDSNFCPYCGTRVIYSPEKNPEIGKPVQRKPVSCSVSFKRSERTQVQNFKETQTSYNTFPYEIQNCYGCRFYYSASRSNGSTVSCTGTRDVYVRDWYSEYKEDDDGWIYVGSFDYDEEGEPVEVDLTWYDTAVYAVAIVREKMDNRCSFSASWGKEVTFYYHEW